MSRQPKVIEMRVARLSLITEAMFSGSDDDDPPARVYISPTEVYVARGKAASPIIKVGAAALCTLEALGALEAAIITLQGEKCETIDVDETSGRWHDADYDAAEAAYTASHPSISATTRGIHAALEAVRYRLTPDLAYAHAVAQQQKFFAAMLRAEARADEWEIENDERTEEAYEASEQLDLMHNDAQRLVMTARADGFRAGVEHALELFKLFSAHAPTSSLKEMFVRTLELDLTVANQLGRDKVTCARELAKSEPPPKDDL